MEIPHTRRMEWPELPANRFASRIRTQSPDGCRVALLGMPDDTGIGLNHGRLGAAHGPDAIRVALTRYGVADPDDWVWPGVFDAGDVIPGESLSTTHDRVTEAAGVLLDAGLFPIGLGGGHDLTYAFVRALAQRVPTLNGIYLDAHLDVRETEGSGMPFRRLVGDCGVHRLDVIGLSPMANSRDHSRWFHSHGGRVDSLDPHDDWPGDAIFFSLDLDVLDCSVAPGVSATNPMGWTVQRASDWVMAAGRCDKVRCFDIMELSPPHDVGGMTARVAAHLLLSFLRGYAGRPVGANE